MKVFGKPLSEYFAFGRLFFILVPLVGFLRLGLSLQGVPQNTVRLFSMTAVGTVGVVYFAIRVHTARFGSYKQLLVLVAIQNFLTHMVSSIAVLLTIMTGVTNIFSAPEYSIDPNNQWLHLAVHALIASTLGALPAWGIGSLILAITRKVSR